eukprot:CAMPEP_0117670670 /NCGR_PEP_ID=MMETSP0804-20121206/12899_1 /TAXON_ID=1074897 /ORGANISM="Tetraselmis astigmatica, Strain CCMP880" /LENGTH=367 /DNA_ID=CAMNT_0005479029 /DNA_START=330 /DNA_END=1429 /DNA_ORIENTATION=-
MASIRKSAPSAARQAASCATIPRAYTLGRLLPCGRQKASRLSGLIAPSAVRDISMANERVLQFFPESKLSLTLERAVGPRVGEDQQLWETGIFDAEVFPDLPLATTWRSLGNALMRGQIGNASGFDSKAGRKDGTPRWLVRTVGVQCRNRQELKDHIIHQTLGIEDGNADQTGQADALLCVSGTHPVRQLSIMGRILPSSLDTLVMACKLREEGALPRDLSLWAVENPLLEKDASRLQRKVDAGAEVVVTQPPLDWPAFEQWFESAQRSGVLRDCRLVVGLPMLSSAGNLAFWLQLCGAQSAPWAAGTLAKWAKAEEAGAEAFAEWRMSEHMEILRRISQLPHIAGVHMMPLTKRARQDAIHLIGAG